MKKLFALLALTTASVSFAQAVTQSQFANLSNQVQVLQKSVQGNGAPATQAQLQNIQQYIQSVQQQLESSIIANGVGPSTQTPIPPGFTTLWVDPVAGLDTNGGLSMTTPLQHLQVAMDMIPLVPRTLYTINVRAGTLAETVFDNHIYPVGGTFTAGITVYGYDLTTPSITGSTSGTLGTPPTSGATWTGSPGVNWTAHALKGMFVQVTSGGDINRLYPIADNATTTLDLPTYRTNLNGATFNIVQNAATITKAPGQNMSFLIVSSGDGNGLTLQRLNFLSSSFYGIYFANGILNAVEDNIDTGSFAGLWLYGTKTQALLTRTFIANHGTNVGIGGNYAESLTGGALVIDGGKYGISLQGALALQTSSSGHLLIQGTSTAGMLFDNGPLYQASFIGQKYIIRNNTGVGIQFEGGAHGLIQYMEVTGNTSHGIQFWGGDHDLSHNTLNCFTCTITGNGGDGVRVETSHNAIEFQSATITGNTGVGVNFVQVAGQIPSSHNEAFFDTGCTMSGNAHDLSVDGTNFSTIANLRSQSGKFLTDSSSLYNRLSAQ